MFMNLIAFALSFLTASEINIENMNEEGSIGMCITDKMNKIVH